MSLVCCLFLSLLRISLYYNYRTTNTSATLCQFCFWQWVVTMNTFFIIEWFHGAQTHPPFAAPWQQSGLRLISEYFGTKGRLQVCTLLIIDLLKATTWSMFGERFVNYSSTSQVFSQWEWERKQRREFGVGYNPFIFYIIHASCVASWKDHFGPDFGEPPGFSSPPLG